MKLALHLFAARIQISEANFIPNPLTPQFLLLMKSSSENFPRQTNYKMRSTSCSYLNLNFLFHFTQDYSVSWPLHAFPLNINPGHQNSLPASYSAWPALSSGWSASQTGQVMITANLLAADRSSHLIIASQQSWFQPEWPVLLSKEHYDPLVLLVLPLAFYKSLQIYI